MLFVLFPLYLWLAELPKGKPVVAILIAAAFFFPGWPTLFSVDNIAKNMLFFASRYAVRQNLDLLREEWKLIESHLGRVGLGVICFCLWLLAVLLYFEVEGILVASRVLAVPAAFFGALFWVQLCCMTVNGAIGSFFREIGKYSLQLFMLNGYLLTLSRTVLIKLLHISNPLLIILGNMTALLGISYIIIRFVISKVKLFRILTGMV